MTPLFLVLMNCLWESLALAGDHHQGHDGTAQTGHPLSTAPFHLGFDASLKPGLAGHGLIGWIPHESHVGMNGSMKLAYEHREGLFAAQATGGPAFRFGNIVVAPSLGFEMAELDFDWRVGTLFAWTPDRFEIVTILEHGGVTGPWYSTTANIWAGSFGVGAFAQHLEGVGPWMAVRVQHLSFWVAPVMEMREREPGIVVGIHLARH